MLEARSGAGQDARRTKAHKRAMTAATTKNRLSPRRIACARCGASFDCGASAGTCWCMNEAHRLPMPIAANEDCLCPACLRTAALSASIGPLA